MNQLINQLIDSATVLDLRAARTIMLLLQKMESMENFIKQEAYLADKYPVQEVTNTEEHF
jgi:hypothetical protein